MNKFDEIDESKIDLISSPTVTNLHKLRVRWSDGVSIGSETINSELSSYISESGKPSLPYQTDETLVGAHQEFYEKVLSENGILAE